MTTRVEARGYGELRLAYGPAVDRFDRGHLLSYTGGDIHGFHSQSGDALRRHRVV